MAEQAAAAPAPQPPPARGIGIWTMLVALVIVAILALYAVAFTVPAGSVGVLKTFGSVRPGVVEPGLHFKAPAPIQTVQIVDRRQRLLEIRNVELTMDNQFNLHVVTTIGWRVRDAHAYISARPNEASMEESLRAIVQDARSTAAMGAKLDEIVSVDPGQRAKYAAFEERYLGLVRANLDPAFGVEITSLAISGLALPESATATVQQSMAASRRAMAEKYKQEGESEASKIRTAAETTAARLLADATADAVRIKGEADAATIEYNAVYSRTPEAAFLANLLKSLEAFAASVKSQTILLVPGTDAPFNVMAPAPAEGR